MKKMAIFWLLAVLLFGSEILYAEQATVRDCDSIVWSVVQRKNIMKLETTYKDIYTAWQCNSNFKSHNEAINGGLDIGTVIYDVPLKIGGTFDKTQVDKWKETHCSDKSRVVDTKTLLELTKTDLLPADVHLYDICVKGVEKLASIEGLFCWAEPNSQTGVTVFVRWRPYSDSQAIVKSASIIGANPVKKRDSDESFLPAGEPIRTGTTILAFERAPNAATTKFILNTTQGACDAESATTAYYKINGWLQPKVQVTDTKTFSQSVNWASDNCALIENRTSRHCVDDGWKRINQTWRTTGERCGSSVNSATPDPTDDKCAVYHSLFRGCGYDNIALGKIQNCKGSPLLQYDMDVVGQKVSVSTKPKEEFSKEGAYVDQVSIGYSASVDPKTPIVGWAYNVDVLVIRGPDKKTVSLSNASPDAANLKSFIEDGNLVISLGE